MVKICLLCVSALLTVFFAKTHRWIALPCLLSPFLAGKVRPPVSGVCACAHIRLNWCGTATANVKSTIKRHRTGQHQQQQKWRIACVDHLEPAIVAVLYIHDMSTYKLTDDKENKRPENCCRSLSKSSTGDRSISNFSDIICIHTHHKKSECRFDKKKKDPSGQS